MQPITNQAEALRAVALLHRSRPAPLAVDIETYGERNGDALDPAKGDIRLLSIAPPQGAPFLFDLRSLGYNGMPWTELFSNRELVAHNSAFDIAWFVAKLGILPPYWFDTYIAAKLLTNGDAPHNDLGAVLDACLGVKLDKTLGVSDWGAWFLVDSQIRYAADDVAYLGALRHHLIGRLEAEGLTRCFNVESQLLPIVARMSKDGIPADLERLETILAEVTLQIEGREAALRQYLGDHINLESPKQLVRALADIGCPAADTSEATLVKISHPVAKCLLAYRESIKVKQQALTLLEAIGPDGLIHAEFVQMGARSGRFSARSPNLQQIARGPLRSVFTAGSPDQRLIVLDFNQVELRIAAALAPDELMLAAFRDRQDLHRATGAMLLGKPPETITKDERQIAKSAAFGLVYGAGASGLRSYAKATYGIDLSTKRSHEIRHKFFEHYQGLRAWHQRAHAQESRVTEGRTVTGRRRLLYAPLNGSPSDINWNAFQLQTNFPVQGSAADILKLAMVKVAERIPAGVTLRACVHDELILTAPAEIAEHALRAAHLAMTEAFTDLFPNVPIEVEGKICANWGEKA
jgi:DNA polymerase-1